MEEKLRAAEERAALALESAEERVERGLREDEEREARGLGMGITDLETIEGLMAESTLLEVTEALAEIEKLGVSTAPHPVMRMEE